DIGDDAVVASDYGIKNLKRVVPNLIKWTYAPNDAYDNLADMHKAVVRQYVRYLYHVLKNIGNNYVTKRTVDEKGSVYQPVPKAKVKAAVDYLGRQLFEAPLWMYPQEITQLIPTKTADEISDQQNQTLTMLLSSGMLYNINQKAMQFEGAYTVPEFLNDLQQTVWTKFSGNEKLDFFRRSSQRSYVEKMGMLLLPKELDATKVLNNALRSDVRLYGHQHLILLRSDVVKLMVTSTGLNKLHYENIIVDIDKILSKLNKTDA
ncbi:MAG: zinc-dependent metalloprotease, partial [Pedobacter sp.]